MKKAIKLTVSFALSALFLWIAFRKVNLQEALHVLRELDLFYVGLFILSQLFTQAFRIVRWGILTRPFATLSASSLIRISNLGMMLVLVLPLRLGEFARPYLVKREANAPLSAGIGAVAVERTLDGLLVTLFFFLSTSVIPAEYAIPTGLRVAAFTALGIFSGAAFVIVGTLLSHGALLGVLRKVIGLVSQNIAEKVVNMVDAFVSGLRSLPNWRSAFMLVAITTAYWVINGLGYYAALVGFSWGLPWIAGYVIVSVVVLGIMIPAGPGFLGTYQGAILLGLAVFHIDATQAAAYGLVVYPCTVLIQLALGLPYLFGRTATVRQIMDAADEPSVNPA